MNFVEKITDCILVRWFIQLQQFIKSILSIKVKLMKDDVTKVD